MTTAQRSLLRSSTEVPPGIHSAFSTTALFPTNCTPIDASSEPICRPSANQRFLEPACLDIRALFSTRSSVTRKSSRAHQIEGKEDPMDGHVFVASVPVSEDLRDVG